MSASVRLLMLAALAAVPAAVAAAGADTRALAASAMLAQASSSASSSVSPDAAAERVRAVSGGRILDVRLEGSVYRVKVLLDGGRVRVYRVDAATGRVIQ